MVKAAIRRVLPAPLRIALRGVLGWQWFEGNYRSWAKARAASTGYDDQAIIAKVLRGVRIVREGRGAFERDGIVFHEPLPEPGLLAAFGDIAAANAGKPIRVLDFGGSLGTTYWRHRHALAELGEWSWSIVEQPRFALAGRHFLNDTPLRFFDSVESALHDGGEYDVLLASTSLQYLENPHATLLAWANCGFPWILLNNVPLHRGAPDRIAVQHVPPEIYAASYPVWFFNRDNLLGPILPTYDLTRDYASEAQWQVGWRQYHSTGMLLRHRQSQGKSA